MILLKLNTCTQAYTALTVPRQQLAHFTFNQQPLDLLEELVVRVELLRWVLVLLVELGGDHPQQSLARVTRQTEIIQTFLPDAEVDDVLNVAGDDGHL